MSEVLTQKQIDQLLSELLSSGSGADIAAISDRRIKTYDFKSPKKFSKDQLKVIRSVYESFARHLAVYLSGVLRTSCQIKVDTTEEQPYFEYNNALPDIVLMGVFDVKQFGGSIVIEISNEITFTIVEILLGGNGSGKILEREFTEIEISLMKNIFRQMEKSTEGRVGEFCRAGRHSYAGRNQFPAYAHLFNGRESVNHRDGNRNQFDKRHHKRLYPGNQP